MQRELNRAAMVSDEVRALEDRLVAARKRQRFWFLRSYEAGASWAEIRAASGVSMEALRKGMAKARAEHPDLVSANGKRRQVASKR